MYFNIFQSVIKMIQEIKLEIYFNIYIVYFYTDLVFSEEEKADPGQLYDELQSNGILTRILGAINQNEYNNLVDYLERMRAAQDTYENSAAGVICNGGRRNFRKYRFRKICLD